MDFSVDIYVDFSERLYYMGREKDKGCVTEVGEKRERRGEIKNEIDKNNEDKIYQEIETLNLQGQKRSILKRKKERKM